MCLVFPDAKPRRKWGIGYKIVQKLGDGEYTCCNHINSAGTVNYPLNQWVTDPKTGLADGGEYPTGFHVSLDKRCLEDLSSSYFPVIKVRFRKAVATQCDTRDFSYGKQVVAREIMNLGEV